MNQNYIDYRSSGVRLELAKPAHSGNVKSVARDDAVSRLPRDLIDHSFNFTAPGPLRSTTVCAGHRGGHLRQSNRYG
jgi:hypothetical protein